MFRDFILTNSQREQTVVVSEKYVDSQLWHACAGSMVQLPPVNSKVFYFPQGHAEHAVGHVDFGHSQIPALIPCKVSDIKYMADPETDEVFAKIRLTPLSGTALFYADGCGDDSEDGLMMGRGNGIKSQEKPASFAKTLTQSDANNGGGFSVPRYCAETIFPRLDYNADPPVQTIIAKDVHGETWKFRHIYRGTPRRHLLTTGWSKFVNDKKLVAGDSIVFLRTENGELCVGVRRVRRVFGGGKECSTGWLGGYSGFLQKGEDELMKRNGNANVQGKVSVESVIEAATLAAKGQAFQVVYYPRASTPEFCVKISSVGAAMQIHWCAGMRFKMAFETEDSSRISWFMGTVSSVKRADPIRWPDSPWRLLQVAWDEPGLLQNVQSVSPWLVELASNMSSIPLSSFPPPRKKLRFPTPLEFHPSAQLPKSSFIRNHFISNSPLCCVSDDIPAGIQGARHSQLGLPSPSPRFNKQESNLFPHVNSRQLDHATPPFRISAMNLPENPETGSLLTTGSPPQNTKESSETKKPSILLFGRHIFPGQPQSEQSCSHDTNGNSSLDGNPEN